MAMPAGGRDQQLPISDINVTPFVDVMLVLLIIFMLTAPHLEQGVPIDLPQVTVASFPARTDELVITVTKDQLIYLDQVAVPLDKVEATLKAAAATRQGKDVYLRADQDVPYGFVVKVMGAAKRAGVAGLGMVTDAEKIKAP